jgi:hypothetical protein
MKPPTARLDEYDKNEWRDVMREAARMLGKTLTDAEFDVMWDDFIEMKRRKNLN